MSVVEHCGEFDCCDELQFVWFLPDTPAANNHRGLNRMRWKGSARVVAEANLIPLRSSLFSLQFCFSF